MCRGAMTDHCDAGDRGRRAEGLRGRGVVHEPRVGRQLLGGNGENVHVDAERDAEAASRHITLSEARSRLYQHRFLQLNTHFAAFLEIYKML